MVPPKEATGRAGRKRVSRRGETGAERQPHKCPHEHLREVFVRKVQAFVNIPCTLHWAFLQEFRKVQMSIFEFFFLKNPFSK